MVCKPCKPWFSLNRPFLGFEDLGFGDLAGPDLGISRSWGSPDLGILGSWDLEILGFRILGSWDLRI